MVRPKPGWAMEVYVAGASRWVPVGAEDARWPIRFSPDASISGSLFPPDFITRRFMEQR